MHFRSGASQADQLPSERPPRRCADCGAPQQLVHTTIDYWESGLNNVQLVDAPIWKCSNGHQEVEIPNAEQLHRLLVNLLIRKQSVLTGSEIRFLRKELVMSGKVFAQQLGMTAEHLSRLETGRRQITSTTDLLVRLVVGWELTRRCQIEFRSISNRSSPTPMPDRMSATTGCNTATTRPRTSGGSRYEQRNEAVAGWLNACGGQLGASDFSTPPRWETPQSGACLAANPANPQ